MSPRYRLAPLAVLFLVGCFTTVRPNTTLSPGETAALETFDYADWAAVLRDHVDARGKIDYPALKTNRARLDRFVALLAVVGPTTRPDLFPTRDHALAYYINAYNALTLFNVLNRYPLDSVNDVQKSFFYFTRFQLDGDDLSLYDLENDLIRPRFAEPRVHFALNCASAGCPALPTEPFLPQTLAAQLERETRLFLHEKRNVTVEGDDLVLSQIFEWYGEDFKPSPAAWVSAQAPDLALPTGANVRHRPYDWALNDRSP